MPRDTLLVDGVTAYPHSVASARVRIANFTPHLRAEAIELTHRPTLSDQEYATLASSAPPARKASVLLRSAARAASRRRRGDALRLVHRLVLLTPLPGVDPPPRIDAYDLDDALSIGSPAAGNARFQWLKREPQRAAASMRRARLVIAGNGYLAGLAREFNPRVEVVPSCVDPDAQAQHVHAEREVVTIGWIGSHTTVPYLTPVLPVLERINRGRQRARLVVVGGDTGLRASWIEHRPWSLEQQSVDLAGFDLGIMPLPDTPWARGKSGYKVLQYFAAGVPAVASPVGVNTDLVSTVRGALAASPTEWEQALTELIADSAARAALGSAARDFVEREYSYRRWAPELASMLRSLV